MLWNWKGKDKSGRVRGYQTQGPDCSAESILAHLRQHYRNLEITGVEPAEHFLPSTGVVERHTFNHGIIDEVERELGIAGSVRAADSIREKFFQQRKPLQSILDGAAPLIKRKPLIIRARG